MLLKTDTERQICDLSCMWNLKSMTQTHNNRVCLAQGLSAAGESPSWYHCDPNFHPAFSACVSFTVKFLQSVHDWLETLESFTLQNGYLEQFPFLLKLLMCSTSLFSVDGVNCGWQNGPPKDNLTLIPESINLLHSKRDFKGVITGYGPQDRYYPGLTNWNQFKSREHSANGS
jgi:hypothetical protein